MGREQRGSPVEESGNEERSEKDQAFPLCKVRQAEDFTVVSSCIINSVAMMTAKESCYAIKGKSNANNVIAERAVNWPVYCGHCWPDEHALYSTRAGARAVGWHAFWTGYCYRRWPLRAGGWSWLERYHASAHQSAVLDTSGRWPFSALPGPQDDADTQDSLDEQCASADKAVGGPY